MVDQEIKSLGTAWTTNVHIDRSDSWDMPYTHALTISAKGQELFNVKPDGTFWVSDDPQVLPKVLYAIFAGDTQRAIGGEYLCRILDALKKATAETYEEVS